MDALKPPVPYTKGQNFSILSHVAPPPTPVTYGCCLNGPAGREEQSHLTPVARCLQNPPLPGSPGSSRIDLTVVDPFRVGDGHNAQVFAAKVQNNPQAPDGESKVLVAKVFDPLYQDDDEGYLNPFLCMNKYYTHEVHAYSILSEFQGGLIPRFYGSYTLDLPVSESAVRVVRLILIEYIPGLSMLQLKPEDFSQPCRQQIMKYIIDFESLAWKYDVGLTDLSPRNTMLLDFNCHSQRKVVFLDFASAIFGRRLDGPITGPPNLFLGQYISPRLRWNRDLAWPFNDWIDWELVPWIEREYAHEEALITPEMRKEYCSP
ncbi:hypothetical protein BO70DRAFT_387225 [Aspergillus heteromorphus CBS 117.55]|uniref:Protein kinase domain-containing protein n=1 Tax=Aspergillus heteromorphus CBS 117.55 TaxID=1448321 RepID=A0A317W7N2_9EURO|nr:uncharacterized protein BO70DRAFT_387225 [Aspergillus heteromorphus CBS 117.55]PWY82089.1 hypothetical protein BO70DRAFT_387225 [Aspergillus heteromorphus CBS 117.55]